MLLPYSGGKSRIASVIISYFPSDVKILYSPFLGGGAVEAKFALMESAHRVIANDVDNYLINYYSCCKTNVNQVFGMVRYVMSKLKWKVDKIRHRDMVERIVVQQEGVKLDYLCAALFFIAMQCGYNGMMHLGHSPFRSSFLNEAKVSKSQKKLDVLKHFQLHNMSFESFMHKHVPKSGFMYLDPPYYTSSSLYGAKGEHHNSFDHELLCKLLKSHPSWVLSYDNSPHIFRMYSDCKIIVVPTVHRMKIGTDKQQTELLIMPHPYFERIKHLHAQSRRSDGRFHRT